MRKEKSEFFVVGKRAVLEALRAHHTLRLVILQTNITKDEIVENILSLARKANVGLLFRDDQWFSRRFTTLNPQGVVAVGEPYVYSEIEELKIKKNSLFLILDRIQDPQNLGAIVRTAECSGIAGIIMQEKESVDVTESVISISSGAVFHTKIVKVKNLANSVRYLKERGVWIVGTAVDAAELYSSLDYTMHPFAVILGNEGEGVRQGLLKECDYVVS
ncbi:MAG: 23S rRNA (guanosine(2251)-2'-O)-methyltransferase RlmB, partial [Caldisericaceae bacterium]